MRMCFLILPIMFLLCSCASTVQVLKPEGERAELTLRNSSKYQVEFLAISAATIYVKNWKISAIPLSEVNHIYIHDYRIHPGLKILGAIPPLLIEGIVMLVAFDVDQPIWGIVSGITIVGTIYGFATGDPKVSFSAPFKEDELEKLKLYCRYPQGLSDEQWKILLQHFNQEDFQSLSPK